MTFLKTQETSIFLQESCLEGIHMGSEGSRGLIFSLFSLARLLHRLWPCVLSEIE